MQQTEYPTMRTSSESQISRRAEIDQFPKSQVAYAAVSYLALLILGTIFGMRLNTMTINGLRRLTFINLLVLLLYFFSISFVLSAALLQSGVDINQPAACNAAIYCCLVFYFISKAILQIFLVERAHAIRAHHLTRLKDPIWTIVTSCIVFGFGTIIIAAFIWPIAEVEGDGKCRIGIRREIDITILAYDVVINMTLTGVFVWLLNSMTRHRRAKARIPLTIERRISFSQMPPSPDDDKTSWVDVAHRSSRTETRYNNETQTTQTMIEDTSSRDFFFRKSWTWIDKLILRSILGTFLAVLPTIANFGLLSAVNGKEQGWLCFTFCTLDVTISVCILHWLTIGSSVAEDVTPSSRRLIGVSA